VRRSEYITYLLCSTFLLWPVLRS